jgi:hypothetical protein
MEGHSRCYIIDACRVFHLMVCIHLNQEKDVQHFGDVRLFVRSY